MTQAASIQNTPVQMLIPHKHCNTATQIQSTTHRCEDTHTHTHTHTHTYTAVQSKGVTTKTIKHLGGGRVSCFSTAQSSTQTHSTYHPKPQHIHTYITQKYTAHVTHKPHSTYKIQNTNTEYSNTSCIDATKHVTYLPILLLHPNRT